MQNIFNATNYHTTETICVAEQYETTNNKTCLKMKRLK